MFSPAFPYTFEKNITLLCLEWYHSRGLWKEGLLNYVKQGFGVLSTVSTRSLQGNIYLQLIFYFTDFVLRRCFNIFEVVEK